MKKTILIGGIALIIILIFSYIYYPVTQAGCDNLKDKIEQQITENSYCDIASDCLISVDMGCDFDCKGYFSEEIDQNLISRFNRRCHDCNEICYFESANPICLNHICKATGGAVFAKTDKQEYFDAEEINIQVTNNLLEPVDYSFPISLCLRPTIMRLEKYNNESKEWLSSGVGLLFDDNKITFYENPAECQAYKIKNCKSEEAEKFIDTDTLKIDEFRNYFITPAISRPCDSRGQEDFEPMAGRYRIGVYYEPVQGLGKQIYSNEFTVK